MSLVRLKKNIKCMPKIKEAYPRHTIAFNREIFHILINSFFKRAHLSGYDKIGEFEQAFADYIGSKEAIAVSAGRMAFYLILKAFNFPRGSEIIVSDYNFPPIVWVIVQSGLSPVFIDIDPHTFNIDASKIEERISSRTKAIFVTHMFGNPCVMDDIHNIADRYGLKIIEDSAHAFGSLWQVKKVGSLSDAAFFSLGHGKNIAAFGGGIITTSDMKIAGQIRDELKACLKPNSVVLAKKVAKTIAVYLAMRRPLFNMLVHPFLDKFDYFLWNAMGQLTIEKNFTNLKIGNLRSLSGLQAAVGMYQLSRIGQYLERKATIVDYLDKELCKIESLSIQRTLINAKNYKQYYVVCAKNMQKEQIINLRRKLLKEGVDTQFLDMHACSTLREFQSYASYCQNAEAIAPRTFEIPSDVSLDLRDLDNIIYSIKQCVI